MDTYLPNNKVSHTQDIKDICHRTMSLIRSKMLTFHTVEMLHFTKFESTFTILFMVHIAKETATLYSNEV
jgi:hypothetical protein